jgi:hypothetical protein
VAAPGLLQSRAVPQGATATLLVAQAVLLATLEERLYGVPHADDVGVYPAYLIVATSAVGEVVVRVRALGSPLLCFLHTHEIWTPTAPHCL